MAFWTGYCPLCGKMLGTFNSAQQLINFMNSMSSGASTEIPVLPPATVPVAPVALSPVDEIVKYKELLEKGIINEQEFEAKKKELLGL